jgi:hypothetical protein
MKKSSPKEEFDRLENIFSVANWKMITGYDTSYWYFSRLGDLSYKVYDFKIIKGDSSLNESSNITYTKNAVYWMRTADTLKLISVDSTSAIWNTLKDDKLIYSFKKLSDDSISLELPAGGPLLLTKTLSLATFLVRSQYDYLHNTHTVDSPLVPHRGKDLQ